MRRFDSLEDLCRSLGVYVSGSLRISERNHWIILKCELLHTTYTFRFYSVESLCRLQRHLNGPEQKRISVLRPRERLSGAVAEHSRHLRRITSSTLPQLLLSTIQTKSNRRDVWDIKTNIELNGERKFRSKSSNYNFPLFIFRKRVRRRKANAVWHNSSWFPIVVLEVTEGTRQTMVIWFVTRNDDVLWHRKALWFMGVVRLRLCSLFSWIQ